MNNERSKYWDIIKGLAIIAVVYGHSGASHIKIVYLYHLPLFFFISGFFYKEKYSNDPYLYTTNKIRAIIFPAIKYYLIFTILHNVLFKLNIYAPIEGDPMITQVFPYDWMNMIGAIFNSLFMTSWETIGGPIWFVKPLFVVMVTFCFIRYFFYVKLSKLVIKKELLIALTILGVSFIGMQFVKENITLPWRAEIGLLVLPIVYYGYILNERFDKDKLRGGLFILNIILIIFILNKNGGIDLSANRINNSIYFFLGCFSGIYINLYIGKIILLNSKISSIIAYIGSRSFDIMALHIIAFKIVDIIDVKINGYESWTIARYPVSNTNLWIIYTFIGIIIPLGVIFLVDRTKRKCKLLFG